MDQGLITQEEADILLIECAESETGQKYLEVLVECSGDGLVEEGDFAYFKVDLIYVEKKDQLSLGFTDGSAVSPDDYSSTGFDNSFDGGLTWTPYMRPIVFGTAGDYVIWTRTAIVDDTVGEPDEMFTFNASVSNLKDPPVVNSASATIVDQDPEYVSILVSPDTISLLGITTVIVTVEDYSHNPVAGETVNFTIDVNNSGGIFATSSAVTDVNGQASVSYVGGPTEGTDTIRTTTDNNGVYDTETIEVVDTDLLIIDFETLPDGTVPNLGDPILESYADWGVHVSQEGVTDSPSFANWQQPDANIYAFAGHLNNDGYAIVQISFDIPVYSVKVDVSGGVDTSITMTAKDIDSNIIESVTATDLIPYKQFNTISLESYTRIASVEFTTGHRYSLLLDNLVLNEDECFNSFEFANLWRVGTITTGDCNDTVIVHGENLESTLDTGLGSDDISIGDFILRGELLAGEGNNIINVASYVYDTTITSGAGNDIINIGSYETRLSLNSGAGDDEISINGQLYEGSQITGEGNDVLEVRTTSFVRAHIDMGPGNDILALSGDMSDYNITEINGNNYVFGEYNNTLHVYNVEAIVFGDGIIIGDQELGGSYNN
jgi:hypothetical protein